MKTEEINCPLCNNNKPIHWKMVKNWNLDKCSSCGLVFVNPCPSEELIQNAYTLPSNEYVSFFQTEDVDMEGYQNGNANWQYDTSKTHMDFIESKIRKTGRILDIGCGSGVLLKVAKDRGWEVAGIDPGDWKQDPQNDRALNIQRCTLSNAQLTDNSFDVIYMGSVLEHLYDPIKSLQEIHQLLKPGGLLYITGLPNIRSWTIIIGIDRWIGNHPPGHLLYFSIKTTRFLLNKTGFSNINIHSSGMPETILEKLFNRKGLKYSGSYAGKLHEPTLMSLMFRNIRAIVYKISDLTQTGSVLSAMAYKNAPHYICGPQIKEPDYCTVEQAGKIE